jgi:hypothetical protein
MTGRRGRFLRDGNVIDDIIAQQLRLRERIELRGVCPDPKGWLEDCRNP